MRHWIVGLFLIFSVGGLFAQEEILEYHADIHIENDGKIIVVETLEVRVEGDQIKRGITRNIPIVRPDERGVAEPAPITVISVKRDGKKEKYRSERNSRDLVLYLGSKDKILDPGVYTYEITYTSLNQIGFFEEYDELYWNVIGNNVIFPVRKFSASVYLPVGAEYLQGSCYTGSTGSRESACELEVSPDGSFAEITGTRALQPYEGFTVGIAWPKGFVKDAFSSKLKFGWKSILLFLVGFFAFLVKGYQWWAKVGIDPPERAIVPDWKPPAGMSPAEVSYVYHRSVTDKALTAALVEAGVKGRVRIENVKKKFTFYRLDGDAPLEEEEAVLVDRLVPDQRPFELKRSTYTRYQSARSAFMQAVRSKLDISEYFRHNWSYVIRATLIISLIVAMALSIGMLPKNGSVLKSAAVTFFIAVVAFGLTSVPLHLGKWYRWLIFVPVWFVTSVVFLGIYSDALFFVKDYTWAAIIIGLSSLATAGFNYLIYAPTELGQEMTAKIKGFRMYLDKSEKEMLNYFTPPEKTPELFEKMLPYAIALGVENKWGKKFEGVLAKAISEGTYVPIWYAGNIHNINSLHSNFASAVSSAAPKSSSSGGSSGGGFSGGGGGGGGVGGW